VPPIYFSPSKLAFGIALTTLAALMSLSVALAQPQSKRPRARAALCQRFASPRGEDSNRGTKKSPFESAGRLAQALKPGETGCLFSGIYRGNVHLIAISSQGRRVTLRSAPGGRATLCGFVEFMPGASFWRLSRVNIDGSCTKQMTVQILADNSRLDHVDVTNRHAGPSCILIGYRNWQPRSVRIDHDRVHDCGHPGSHWDHGIYAAKPRGAQITDNYVYGNAGFGIHLYDLRQRAVDPRRAERRRRERY
jgi:hypothetical protein